MLQKTYIAGSMGSRCQNHDANFWPKAEFQEVWLPRLALDIEPLPPETK
jgi:hypothetical protein